MAKRCAYLTMVDDDGWSIDAGLAFPFMQDLGWQVETIVWRNADEKWDSFDAVYIGTPWDYPEAPSEFLTLLRTIDQSRALLVNDLALVEWTIPKTYLRDLEQQGAAIVPSVFPDEFSIDAVKDAFDCFGADEVIIKPVVSTNATNTFRLSRDEIAEHEASLLSTFSAQAAIIQPFIREILTSGECSLFYLGGSFSHAIRKVPASGDFRVQEEYGASIVAIDPPADLVAAGDRVIEQVHPAPVYARVDFVSGSDGGFLLMELELIEPSMYLRTDKKAPRRFALAFDNHYNQAAPGESA